MVPRPHNSPMLIPDNSTSILFNDLLAELSIVFSPESQVIT